MSLFGLIRRARDDDKLPSTPVLRELPAAEPLAAAPVAPAPPTSSELRQMLFDAIANGDEARLTTLCREHRKFVQDYAPAWLIVPDSLRANPAAAKWYTRGLRQLLQRLCEVPTPPPRS
jgi:hypothetical protein